MLVNSKVLFEKAQEGHYAIPSANVLDMESYLGLLLATEYHLVDAVDAI